MLGGHQELVFKLIQSLQFFLGFLFYHIRPFYIFRQLGNFFSLFYFFGNTTNQQYPNKKEKNQSQRNNNPGNFYGSYKKQRQERNPKRNYQGLGSHKFYVESLIPDN